MTSEQWQGLKDKLNLLLEIEASQRSAHLDEIAGSDDQLRRELQSLLNSREEMAEDFLHSPLCSETDSAASFPASLIGKTLGPYQIVSEIGRGGMGEVYRAIRVDAQYQKEVAIKLIRTGTESAFVVARFKNERQILAKLEHPNIARLLDGGTTETGVPYFVMELIEGESILQYCDRHSLDIPGRLGLFLQVCAAVQFAHQHLVIHRDIKPGNILVTADGTPKLLDFGISKVLGSESDTSPDEHAVTVLRMLTPAYASPEQVKGESITTASDVYSLGVVLYELLAGRHPYHTDSTHPHNVQETKPEKLSAAIKKEAARRNFGLAGASGVRSGGTGEKLSLRVRGDLDNIVLMAMREDPRGRYASVEQFAEDIRRYLGNLPVIARKDTARYRASKFALRHKAGVAASAAVLLAFLAAFVVTVREERIAQRRFNDVHALADSLIFDVHDSIKDLPGSTPARKMIADRAVLYLNSLARESTGDIKLQGELATAYERLGLVQGHTPQDNLGDTKGSLESYKKALELRKEIDTKSTDWNDRLAVARCYRLVADIQAVVRSNEARPNIDRAIATSELLNGDHPNNFSILHELASEYNVSAGIGYRGDPNEQAKVEGLSNKTLTTYDAALKIRSDDLDTLFEYAVKLRGMGSALENTNPKAALDYYQRVLEIERDLTRRSNAVKYARGLALAYRDLATVYDNIGNTSKWIANQTMSLEILRGISRADPQNAPVRRSLAIEYVNMALVWSRKGNFRLADEDWRQSLVIIRELVASDPENYVYRHFLAGIVANGGTILMHKHKPQAALKQFDEARSIYESLRDAGGGASPFEIASAAQCREKMGEAEARTGNTFEAADDFHRALATAEPLIARKPPEINALYAAADAYSGLADLVRKKLKTEGPHTSRDDADWEEARVLYSKSLDTWRKIEHPNRTAPGNSLDAGDPSQVEKKLAQCKAALTKLHSRS